MDPCRPTCRPIPECRCRRVCGQSGRGWPQAPPPAWPRQLQHARQASCWFCGHGQCHRIQLTSEDPQPVLACRLAGWQRVGWLPDRRPAHPGRPPACPPASTHLHTRSSLLYLQSLPCHSRFFSSNKSTSKKSESRWSLQRRIRAPWGCRREKADSRRLQAPPHHSSRRPLQGV